MVGYCRQNDVAVTPGELARELMTRRSLAVDGRERESVDRFVAELERLEDPYNEYADPVHVTASAIVVSDDRSAVCLHRHKRMGIWLQPGGHIEPGESLVDAALREAVEETGLSLAHGGANGAPLLVHVDVHGPPPKPHCSLHLDTRFLLVASDPAAQPAPGEGESPDAAWFSWDEAIARADVGLAGALRALRS